MISGVYYGSWNEWKMRLKHVDKRYNVVYLAFANPNGKLGGLIASGLNFTSPMEVIIEDIKELKARGVVVMLSVGGATYLFPNGFDALEMVKLANYMGCDGIDIDWEPNDGNTKQWDGIIQTFHDRIESEKGVCKMLSAAVWSTGCMQPVAGDMFKGMNISGLVNKGAYLNWLNIMAYDCGPPEQISPLGSFYTYRVYYSGPLCMGFEVGKMGWGDYLTTKEDVAKAASYVSLDPLAAQNGFFIWEYFKDDYANGVTQDYIIDTCKHWISEGGKKKETVMECPWCMNLVTLAKSNK